MAVMVLVVKCLICNKELTYTQGDPSILVTHFKFEHSNHRKGGGDEPSFERIKEKLINEKQAQLINQSIQTDLKVMSRGRIYYFNFLKHYLIFFIQQKKSLRRKIPQQGRA